MIKKVLLSLALVVAGITLGTASSVYALSVFQTVQGGTGNAGTLSGLVKANGTSPYTTAAAGTDYAPPTSGSSILKGNGSGGFTNAVSNTDYQAVVTLTTTGSSGAATFNGTTLNIPQYTGGGASFSYPFPNNATTSSLTFGGVTVTGAATGCATFTTGVLSSTGIACGSGSGGTFPFTPTSYGNATSSTIGFLAGLVSNGSTTIAGTLHLPLANGGLAIFGNAVISSATTTAGTGLTYSANSFNVNTTQNISTLSNLSVAGLVQTTSGGVLSSALLTSGQVTTALGFTPASFSYPFPANATTSSLTFGGVTVTGTADGCATFASAVLGSTGSPCGSGGGATFGQTLAIDAANWISPTTTIYGLNASASGLTYGFGIGDKLLGYASSTNFDTFFGLAAGGQNATTSATAGRDAAFGSKALNANTTGTDNAAFGANALVSNTTGIKNTAAGVSSLDDNISGNGNVALGFAAGVNETGSNDFYVNNVSESNLTNDKTFSLLFGTFSGSAASLTGQQLTINGVLNLSTTTAGCLNTSSTGVVYAATCTAGGSSFSYPFVPQTWGNSTTSVLGVAGFIATGSSTISSLGTGFVQSTNGLLSSAALTSSNVTTALGFTPFGGTNPLPIANGGSNATSFSNTNGIVYYDGSKLSNIFAGGSYIQAQDIIINASSTIGAGNQAGGLTISGGATTTGTLVLPSLKTSAGAFLVVDALGNVIATTTPQAQISLTTTGTSGAATFTNNVLNVPQYSSGASSPQVPTIIVAASGGTVTTLQAALNLCGTLGGGNIALTDSSYVLGGTGVTIKGSNCHLIGRGQGTTTITITGATTAIKSSAAASQWADDSIENLTITGDSNASGVAFDLSDMSHFTLIHTVTSGVGTSLVTNDTQNVTFYDDIENNDWNDNIKWCWNASSTNPVNGDKFDNNFCGGPANSGGINLDNANGDEIRHNFLEPASVTGTIGISIFDQKMTNNNSVFNNDISGNYIEANGTGIKIAASVSAQGPIHGNLIENNITEANTTDYNVTATEEALNTWVGNLDSNFGNPLTSFQAPLGVGTSSQMANIANTTQPALAVSANSTLQYAEFVVAQSQASNRTDLTILNSGALQLGTTTAGCLNTNTTGIVYAATCAAGGGSAFPFTPTTNFSVNTSATSTPIYDTAGIFASSTSQFVNSIFSGSVGIGTTSPFSIFAVEASTTSKTGTIFSLAYNQGGTDNTILTVASSTNALWAIGTSSGAVAQLDDVGLFGAVPINNAFFQIASSSQTGTSTLFLINNVGHVIASSTNPAVTCTGGTLTSFKGDDTHGEGVCGTGSTVMTVTFGAVWSAAPICTVTNQSMSITSAMSYTISATALTISQAVGMATDKLDYLCEGVVGPQ